MIRFRCLKLWVLVFAGGGLAVYGTLFAGVGLAQNVTQGYRTDRPIQKGMIVGLEDKDGSKVQPLARDQAASMLGVTVAPSDSPVSLSSPDAAQQAFVATYGQYDVLVSTQNGQIQVGDFITTSALTGVGMKADNTQELIVGKAVTAFDGKQGVENVYTLNTSAGKKQVQLGRVKVDVGVAHNPLYAVQAPDSVPTFLHNAVDLVTDRPVSASRIYAGLAILLLTLFLAGGILYAGVRSGMVAIGRNPLAKHSVWRNLIQVTLMALIIFVIGLFAVYLLLRA